MSERGATPLDGSTPDIRTRPTWSFGLVLAAITLAALVVRVAYVFGFRAHARRSGDEVFFAFAANALADGHGFNSPFTGRPAADHPPLTTIVLTPASWLSHSALAQRMTMTLVGAVLVVVIALLARQIAGDAAGLIAAALSALYPTFILGDGVAMSEPLADLCVAATMLFLYRMVRRPDRPGVVDAALAGAAVGIAALARAELALLLVLAVLPTMWLTRGPVRRRLFLGGASVAAFAVVLAPWIGFNLTRFDRPTFVSVNDGITLDGANCPTTYHGPLIGGWDIGCLNPRVLGDDQSVANAVYRHRGMSYARDHLGRLPVVVAARVGRTWSVFRPFQTARLARTDGRPPHLSELAVLAFFALVPFAAAGAWVLRARGVTLVPLVGTLVGVTLVAVVFYGALRTREPGEVVVVVLAAVALDALLRRAGGRDVVPPRQCDHGDGREPDDAMPQAGAGTSTVS